MGAADGAEENRRGHVMGRLDVVNEMLSFVGNVVRLFFGEQPVGTNVLLSAFFGAGWERINHCYEQGPLPRTASI